MFHAASRLGRGDAATNNSAYRMSGARSFFFFSSRRRHTRFDCDWSSDVCSSDLLLGAVGENPFQQVVVLAHGCAPQAATSRVGERSLPPSPLSGNCAARLVNTRDRKSTRLNSSHSQISYAVFCLKKKKQQQDDNT